MALTVSVRQDSLQYLGDDAIKHMSSDIFATGHADLAILHSTGRNIGATKLFEMRDQRKGTGEIKICNPNPPRDRGEIPPREKLADRVIDAAISKQMRSLNQTSQLGGGGRG